MKTEGLPRNSAPQKIVFFSVRELTPAALLLSSKGTNSSVERNRKSGFLITGRSGVRIQTTLDLYTQEDSDEARAAQGEFLRALGMQSELVQ
jgi:hypothetical protein